MNSYAIKAMDSNYSKRILVLLNYLNQNKTDICHILFSLSMSVMGYGVLNTYIFVIRENEIFNIFHPIGSYCLNRFNRFWIGLYIGYIFL